MVPPVAMAQPLVTISRTAAMQAYIELRDSHTVAMVAFLPLDLEVGDFHPVWWT